MDRAYWQQQQAGQTLFPQLEWSRPENRLHAGKLLIIGGNQHGFAAPAEAFSTAEKAGIGTARVLLPDSLRRIVGHVLEQGEYAPSTPSGSFSQKALQEFLSFAAWSDGVLFAGDLGRNSETAIVIEKFLGKSPVATTLTKDAVDYVVSAPHSILHRESTLVVLSLSQLQRLGTAAKFTRPLAFGMDLLHLAEWLHVFSQEYRPYIVVKHHNTILAAVDGQVSSTNLHADLPIWRVHAAATCVTWWLQNHTKPFEAITTAIAAMAA